MTVFNFSDISITLSGVIGEQDSLIFVDDATGAFDPTLFSFEHNVYRDLVISANNGKTITIRDFFLAETPRFDALIFSNTRIDLINENLVVSGSPSSGIDGTALKDVILLDNGTNSEIYSGSGNDIIYASGGNDFILGEDGDDTIFGGDGSDRLSGGKGADYLDGGSGLDSVDYSLSESGVYVNLITSKVYGGEADGDIILSFENVYGSNFDDVIFGNDQRNILYGNAGNDKFFGSASVDYYYGGAGIDVVSFENSNVGVNISGLLNGTGGDAQGDYFNEIESLIGSKYNDYLGGSNSNNTLFGGAGNDTLFGSNGTDTAVFSGVYANYTINGTTVIDNVGTDGVDTLSSIERLEFLNGIYQGGVFTPYSLDDIFIGTTAAQAFDGGSGFDTVNFSSSSAAVNIDLAAATSATGGYAQGDTFVSIESLIGSSYNDQLRGNTANEVFYGGAGNDTIKGLDGNDTLYGDEGVDTLEGNNGNDTLYGGAGADSLKGGAGIDKFAYLSVSDAGDTILDFNASAGEKIDLAAILQNSIGFQSAQAFTAGYLRVAQNGTGTNVYLDVDGTAGSGAEVLLATLQNVTSSGITLSSFILGAGNVAPVANNDSVSTNEDTAITFSVLSNDIDANGDALTVSILTNAANGSLMVNANNAITYRPNANANGFDSFIYQVNDGHGGTANATVSLTVNAVNDMPIAYDDAFGGTQNTNITGNLLSNNGYGVDFDVDGHALSVVAQTIATAHGSVVISANGSFVYTPITGYVGVDSFDYTLSDGYGGSDIGKVSLTLMALGISGTGGNDTITGTADNDTIFGYAGNDNLYGEAGNDTLFGDTGADTLKGRDGNDTLYGGADVDYLEGGNGNDILYGGEGADILKGSAGIDTFVFQSTMDTGNTIQDYNSSAGEKLDISGILIGYDPLTDAITDFVRITDNGTDSYLAVDLNGGADNFVQLATLLGVTGLTDEKALETAGKLVTVV